MDTQAFEKELELCLAKLNKDIDKDWIEIVEELGLDIHYDTLRRMAYGYKKYNDYIQETGMENVAEELREQLAKQSLEIKKQKVLMSDLRTEINKQVRNQARYENLIDLLSKEINQLNKINPFYNNENKKVDNNLENRKEMLISIADIHYGLKVDDNWNKYNSDIAKDRMNKLINKSIKFGKAHNCNIVHLLVCGDVLNNNIHLTSRLSNRENVTEQIVGVSEMLSNAIAKLSNEFEYVTIHLTSGNHDRIIPKKEDNDYEDNFINIVKEFVKLRTNQLKNVIIDDNQFGHDIVKFNMCGKSIIGTHGDKIPTNQAISRFSTMFEKVDYVIQGHYHHNSLSSIGDSKVLTIGSFSGTDRYAREKGLISKPTQKVLILEENCNDEIMYEIDLS